MRVVSGELKKDGRQFMDGLLVNSRKMMDNLWMDC